MTKIIQWVIKMASEAPKTTLSLVGQGSILDKTPLHLVGYLGKNAESSVPPPDGWCPVCKAKGRSQALRAYRINFTQSLLLCSNPQCIYPLGYTPLDNIITTTEDLKKPCHPSKQKKRILETSPPSLGCVKKRRIDCSDCKTFIQESTRLCPVNNNCNSSPSCMQQECGDTIQSQTFLSSSNVSRLAEENLPGGSAAGSSSNGTQSLVHGMSVPPAQGEPSGFPKGLCSDMQCKNDGEIHDLNSVTNSSLCGRTVETSDCDNSVHGNLLNGAQHEGMGQNPKYAGTSFTGGSSVVAENGHTETNLGTDTNVCESSVQSPKPQDVATEDSTQESLPASYSDFSHFASALDGETLNTTFSSMSVSELINDTNPDVHSFGETSSSPTVMFQGSESITGSAVAEINVSIDAVLHLIEKINVSDTSLTDSELSEPDCSTKYECRPPTDTAASSDLQQSGLRCDLQDRSPLNVSREANVVEHNENDTSTANLLTSEKSHLALVCPNDAESPGVLPQLQVEGQSSPEVCTSVLGDNSSVEDSCSTSQITSLSGDASQGSISRKAVAEAMESPSKNHNKAQSPIGVRPPESSLPAPTVEQGCGNTSLNLPAENQSSSNNVPDMPPPVANPAVEQSSDRNKDCKYLQWRNKHSLCWLDCIMFFLVHSGTLKNFMSKGDPIKESVIHTLFEKYNEASDHTTRLGDQGKLALAQKCLEEVRMVLFDKVKDPLKCTLGDQESPVFVFPLLLQQEPVFEKLFLHSFSWSFSCKLCGHETRDRCQKTITTFTKIVPDWNPLNAVHTAPCNKCQDPGQKRKMNLERVHSIFVLHFVEGLPSSDLQAYSFQFEENVYEVRGVIQYRGNHFSVWMECDDGTWLESDDLKGSYCRQHKCFAVPSNEIHIVIWERSTLKVPEKQRHPSVEENNPETSLDQSASSGRVQSPSSELLETTSLSTADSLTPNKPDVLFGFEGYADDDIITLTLTEIQVDALGNPIENGFNPVDSFSDPSETSVDMVEKDLAQDDSNGLDSVADDPQSQEPTTLPSVLPSPSLPDTAGCQGPTMCTLLPLHIDRLQTSVSPGSKTVNALHAEGRALPNQSPSCKPESIMDAPVGHEASVKAANFFKEKCEPLSPPGKKARVKHSTSPSPEGAKKGVVGSWMKSLLYKNPTLANLYNASKKPSTLNTTSFSPLKVTDSHPFKKAQNFGGFKARLPQLPAISANEPSSGSPTPIGQDCPSTQTFHTPVVPSLLTRGRNGRLSVSDHSSSPDDKIRRLRLKLLKRLKSKKKELATLDALAKTQSNNCADNQISSLPEATAYNRREHLRGFLQELQDHIDNADNESMCTVSSSASICSSPGDAEFFAELFSPSTTTAVAATTDENSGNLLEMWMDGMDTSLPSEQTNHHPTDYPQLTNGDHFTTCKLPTPQKTPVGSSVTNGSFQSSAIDQNFGLPTASTFEMMPEETSFMSSFDIF
uniref:USP domain-containing protein n=1 Tax=Leptobrachium leishanense TaxID=445787 RepID=A0A8C5QAC0_9ANUR